MPSENLQTVIVSKDVAKSPARAARIAEPLANRMRPPTETSVSWRFRQRPKSDFKKGSFRAYPIPGHPGVAYVYGKLKASARNPAPPPMHRKSARTVITEKPVKRIVYRGYEGDIEIPVPPKERKRSKSEPPPFHKESSYLFLGRRRKTNPGVGDQRYLQWKGTDSGSALREWDFWLTIQPKIRKARGERALAELAKATLDRDINSLVIRGLIFGAISDRARGLSKLFTRPSPEADERYVRSIAPSKNPTRKKTPNKANKKAARKPSKKKASKKKASKRPPRAIKLKAPRQMPDPGPCAWIGSTLELAFDRSGADPRWTKKGEKDRTMWACGRREWMFLWSPKYKAVVVVPKPRGLKGGPGCAPRKGAVVRDGGAAQMFERFASRAAEDTQEIEVPDCKLQKLGKGVHIVYRSDKWSESRKTTDYIHDYGKDVQIYCGPSIEKPEVFICFGGKLTLTERGLVF